MVSADVCTGGGGDGCGPNLCGMEESSIVGLGVWPVLLLSRLRWSCPYIKYMWYNDCDINDNGT